jgi:hypothetical protein
VTSFGGRADVCVLSTVHVSQDSEWNRLHAPCLHQRCLSGNIQAAPMQELMQRAESGVLMQRAEPHYTASASSAGAAAGDANDVPHCLCGHVAASPSM